MPAKQTKVTWDAIPCEVCGEDIPFYDDKGAIRTHWRYKQLKTCSDHCYALYQARNKRRTEEPYIPTPMDYFLGRPCD